MLGRQLAQRMALGVLVVLVAASAALGTGYGTSATVKDATKSGDFGSKGNFRYICTISGGTFSEDGIGNTNCHWKNGGWTQCDANGNDCWYTPPGMPPPDGEDMDIGRGGEATTDVGEPNPSGPEIDTPTPTAAQPRAVVHDDDAQDQDSSTGKAKGKKGKKGGTGRKK